MNPEYSAQFGVDFRNDSGETAPAGALMRVTGIVSLNGRTVFTINKPSKQHYLGILINGPIPVADGGYGRATRTLPAVVLTDTAGGTINVGDICGTVDGSWGAQANRGGQFQLVGAAGGGTVIEAGPLRLIAYPDADVSKGTMGTFKIYHLAEGDSKGDETDTGSTIQAYAGCGDIPADARCVLAFVDGWEVVEYECSPDA